MLVRVKDGEEAYGPQVLPDGQHVLFTLATGTARDRWDKARIVVQSLSSGEPKTLIEGGSDARYLPTGHLVYALSGLCMRWRSTRSDWRSTALAFRSFKVSGDRRAESTARPASASPATARSRTSQAHSRPCWATWPGRNERADSSC